MCILPRQADNAVPVYSLFLGSKGGDAWLQSDRAIVLDETSRLFESFTVSDAEGCYQGRPVPTIILRIGTGDRERVMRLAYLLGKQVGQSEIGIEVYGRYTSVKIGQV